jgi:hypothetical protein
MKRGKLPLDRGVVFSQASAASVTPEVVVPWRDGTGDIIRVDQMINDGEIGVLLQAEARGGASCGWAGAGCRRPDGGFGSRPPSVVEPP